MRFRGTIKEGSKKKKKEEAFIKAVSHREKVASEYKT